MYMRYLKRRSYANGHLTKDLRQQTIRKFQAKY